MIKTCQCKNSLYRWDFHVRTEQVMFLLSVRLSSDVAWLLEQKNLSLLTKTHNKASVTGKFAENKLPATCFNSTTSSITATAAASSPFLFLINEEGSKEQQQQKKWKECFSRLSAKLWQVKNEMAPVTGNKTKNVYVNKSPATQMLHRHVHT